MKADQYSRIDAVKIKARADYRCQYCGSTEMVQAHAPNRDHSDWRKGICLCVECHSEQHPNVPRTLFLTRMQQPYWPNISARTLAREFNCHNRTVIRAARQLGIKPRVPLSKEDKEQLRIKVAKLSPTTKQNERLYSIKEAAELLGISRAYVYYLKNTGKIKVEKIGSQYVVSQKEIDRYKRDNKQNDDCNI